MLLCTVRDCRLLLAREGNRLVCPRGHSFDVARKGYVNLLQPQDSRSRHPGDSAAAVAARRRLHDKGVAQPLFRAIAETLRPGPGDALLDAGCGDGYYPGTLALETGCDAHGIDISLPAIEAAARRYPRCEWVVANADRFVPYADRSFAIVSSIVARMNPAEFRRVLRDDGRLLVAVPAPDDLIELRGPGRDRTARTIEDFASAFHVSEQKRVTSTLQLDESAVNDVLLAIYRPLRAEPVNAMPLTFSLDLLLFRPRQGSRLPLDVVSKNRKECSTYEHTKDQDQSKAESTTKTRKPGRQEAQAASGCVSVPGQSRAGTSRDSDDPIISTARRFCC